MATFVSLLKHQNEYRALNQLKFVILIGGVSPPLENRPVASLFPPFPHHSLLSCVIRPTSLQSLCPVFIFWEKKTL
jgi:hypothetical protein